MFLKSLEKLRFFADLFIDKDNLHEMRNLRIIFFGLIVLCAAAPLQAEDLGDSWALNQPPNARVEDTVERWCEISGSRQRYANFPIPGYRPCGTVAVTRSCDPVGKRYFGPGAPYQYLDCGSGPRIQITSSLNSQDFRGTDNSVSDIGRDLAAIDAQRKEYDELLEHRGRKIPPRHTSLHSNLSRKLNDVLQDLPIDPGALSKVLEGLGSQNEQLRQLLDE